MKIKLGEYKDVNSVNVDNFNKISLDVSTKNHTEYDIKNILDVTEVFEKERQNTFIYRIYGGIEYFSMLNGLKVDYNNVNDFFNPVTNGKNIYDDFNFYILKASSDNVKIINKENQYIKYYEVVSELNNFELFNAGFSKNIFNEQKYVYDLNIDIDLTNDVDSFGFPQTELYLYWEYQTSNDESLESKLYNEVNGVEYFDTLNTSILQVGDIVYGDLVDYNMNDFSQTTINKQEFIIGTEYSDDGQTKNLKWKYKPIIPLKLRVFSEDLERVNVSGTSYINISEIPEYATKIDDDGNYIWRDLLDIGYFDPISNVGVIYPFVNKKQYVFNDLKLSIYPDLTDTNTEEVFNEIVFNNNETISIDINSDLNNIGKPCQ